MEVSKEAFLMAETIIMAIMEVDTVVDMQEALAADTEEALVVGMAISVDTVTMGGGNNIKWVIKRQNTLIRTSCRGCKRFVRTD